MKMKKNQSPGGLGFNQDSFRSYYSRKQKHQSQKIGVPEGFGRGKKGKQKNR